MVLRRQRPDDRDHADAGILDVEPQQLGKLALDLIADALRTL